jgi:opacity protein-like surface antigen
MMMRRFVLGVVLAAGLTIAVSGAASAQVPNFPTGAGGPWLAGNTPIYNGISGVGYGAPYGPYGQYSQTLGDPWGYGFPASYGYPYGFQFGQPPYWGQNGGVGFTFNTLNNGVFGTGITSTNTSFVGTVNGISRSVTQLPLSALGRISQIPTQVTNSINDVIIR